MLISDLEGSQRKEKHEGSLQNQSERGQRELNSWGRGAETMQLKQDKGFPFCYCFFGCLKETA